MSEAGLQGSVMGKPFVIGLGASAGGLEALEQFFDRMAPDTGMTFVVVQHLSPDFKSLMDDILSRRTTMAVRVADEGMTLAPNTVYLNPPKKLLAVAGGRLVLTDKDPAIAITYPIDHFLRSLAQEPLVRAAAIIFSGTGSDGSRGIVEIRRAGGLVIAQDPSTAGFDGMPRNAIDSGSVDLTLAPDEMADALVEFQQGRDPRAIREASRPEGFAAMVALLHEAYGVDFAEYKLPTIARRTERRMQAGGDDDLEKYAARLATNRSELDALYYDLLIGVTQFFRDAEAFELLQSTLVPDLLKKLPPGEELRIWVAGCATGEEAYSLAIIVRECLDAAGLQNPAKIFATDIHREALRFAAIGIYDDDTLADVSAERRARFFVAKDGGYQVVPAVRSMVVFAPHNLLQDVPFNKLDLVTCRNLLIYLQPPAQRRALNLFHFGLNTGGLLFLGSSESLADLVDEFDVVDAHWKIFRKQRDVRRPSALRATAASNLRARSDLLAPLAPTQLPDPGLIGTYDALLDAVAPTALLIGARRNLVQTFGGASRFLQVPEGRATNDAIEMLRDDLRVAVTGALQRVFTEHEPVQYRGLRVDCDGLPIVVDVTVREIKNRRSGATYALVVFHERGPATSETEPVTVPADERSRDQILALEMQLRHAKENLQTTIEELETSNEELQATNEELVASNEELQTTNEELHSVNEELFTVNTEFQRKIGELTEITTDLDLLLASTEVHTLFLDRELRVRRFTPRMAEIFHLVAADAGRRIDDFNHSLTRPSLYEDLRMVVATGTPFEQQVRDGERGWFLLRVLPYRRGATTDGAVLTLIDITGMKRFEQEAQSKHEQLSSILTNSPHPVFIRDVEGRYVVADESFRRLAGRDPTGLKPEHIFSVDVAAMLTHDDARILDEGMTVETEETIPTPSGPRTFLAVKFPLRDADGRIRGIGGIQTDVTSLKRAEADARESSNRRDRFLATLSHELRNPLAAVLNASRVLTRGQLPPEEIDHWHQIILERALHMARLVDDLLDVARLTQDKLVLAREQVDLRTAAQGVVDEVQATFRERRIELVTQFDGDLLVHADRTRLHQLQVNLLTNAARHTPAGGRTTYVLRRVGDMAEICVADNGEGIALDMLDRIFELFVQADQPGARGRDGGLGVGLSLVRRIAELHGGSVSVASKGLGQGAEFRVRIPLGGVVALPPPPPAPPPAALVEGALGRPSTVLLVDDDPASRSGMHKLLQLDRITVRTASSGEEALAAIAEGPRPDLILLDIGLPGMDGYEVCRRLRAGTGGASLLVFAVTGFGQDADRDAAMRAGFDGHLTKPVDVDDVYALYASKSGKPSAR